MCQIGARLRVTQVKQIHHSIANIPIFETNESQSQIRNFGNNLKGIRLEKDDYLRVFHWDADTVFPAADVSLCVRIVNWRVAQDDADGYFGFEIHAIDSSRSTILFQYPVPSCLVHRKSLYPWLQRGGYILIRYATIKEYDKKHDILLAVRTEHTLVDSLSNTLLARLPAGEIHSEIVSQLSSFSMEVEDQRMEALRTGKEYYQVEKTCEEGKMEDDSFLVMESCERRRLAVQNAVLGTSKQGLIITMNQKRYRVDSRIESQLQGVQKQMPSLATGRVIVVNRHLNESHELYKEELVILEYFGPT